MYQVFTSTPVFNKPAIRFPSVGTTGDNEIPMIITEFHAPFTAAKINKVTSLPRIVQGMPPTTYGGEYPGVGGSENRKMTITGFMDTPTQSQPGGYATPLLKINGNSVTYGDLIGYYYEGRLSNPWQRINPSWFRDPYGRVYATPTMFDFTAQYTEAVPGRVQFTLILMV